MILFPESSGWKVFYHLSAHIVECVSEYKFFCFKKIHKHPHEQKVKETKKEMRKTKETKEEMKKENFAVVNSICGKSNEISE